MELFSENRQQQKTGNYFRKKASLRMFDKVQNSFQRIPTLAFYWRIPVKTSTTECNIFVKLQACMTQNIYLSPYYTVESELGCLKLFFIATSGATWLFLNFCYARVVLSLTLSWRMSLSCMDWFLYDRHLRHERTKTIETISFALFCTHWRVMSHSSWPLGETDSIISPRKLFRKLWMVSCAF